MPIDKLREILKAAGAPLSLDQIMEAMPDGTDRAEVSTLCRQRKATGELVASVEDGKVAYALAPPGDSSAPAPAPAPEPAPAADRRAPAADKPADNVHAMYGRRASDVPGAKTRSLTDQIRELLRGADAPLTAAQIAAALPEANPASVQSLLQQRKKAGEFAATPTVGTAHGYSIGKGAAVAVAVAGPVAPEAAPAAPPRAEPPAAPPPAPGTATTVFDQAFAAAEKALDRYVVAVLPDPDVYFALKASVAAARAARDASREPRHEP